MNELTEAKLNELLTYLMDSVESGGRFLEAQAPLVAQEIISWVFWSNLTVMIVCLIGFVASLLVFMLIRKPTLRAWESNKNEDIGTAIGGTLLGLLCIVGLISTLIHFVIASYPLIQTQVAPRLVVLDWLAQNLK